ncbi:microtubule-associated protein futsch [Takifugu flavidus]|uniref:microtubule-associated protein futsch n=1 Tax=Takifugu flavidus TaxID=433684 RepID=UPI002544D065|nr:microtubule-associated protein futsch [Takifugu flavidus]
MTSVEKRRSSRKSRGRRKHSNGALSDASSTGSFPDETDREVSNLTDRAFRSLCIGDEAVYNDSDLNLSSPCFQSERQRAFSQGGPDGDMEEIKRAARESFSLRMQQYEQNWMRGGMYEAQVHRDPQCGLYGESEPLSATFQHSFVNPSQQEALPRNMEPSSLSNGATEFSVQQRRSRSRVSSLIQAFNTEGYMDGAGSDGKYREWNDQGVWDRSALIGIQTDLAQLSTSHQQTFHSGQLPSMGPFSFKDPTLYSSGMAAVARGNADSPFTRSPHSKHSVSTQVNCNSNVFIHSEFSPFRVWKDRNHFPLQHGDVSGFLNCSEFSQWYETPMYRNLSMESRPQGRYHFQERDIGYLRNNFPPMVPPTAFHTAMPPKSVSVEKRCESELAGHPPHWNRLPPQRPSTASPATEMSRRVQDTISSVKAFQQKLKMMTEQSIAAGMQTNQHDGFISHNSLIYGNDVQTEAPTVVSGHTSTTPFRINQLDTPFISGHQEVVTSTVTQHPASPQPVEHPPVRAESRGATPDVRMSSYKSRATSLLFNLKDNRKRVKSTYSPNKFKASETLEKNRQQVIYEPRDAVIDIPDDPPHVLQSSAEHFSGANIVLQQYVKQGQNTGFSGTPFNSQAPKEPRGQFLQNTGYYQTQGELLHHPGFTGFTVENCTSSQLPNGQNLYEDFSSFTPCKQAMRNNAEAQGGDRYRLRPSYTSAETPRANSHNNQTGEYLISKANPEQHFNETVGRESTKVKHNYSNVSSQNRWRQANNQDAENISLKTAISPWKQEITSLMEKDKHAQESQRAAVMKEELKVQKDRGSGENQQSRNHEMEKKELRENGAKNTLNIIRPYRQQQHEIFEDKQALQYTPHENESKDWMKNYQDRGDQQNFDLSKYECMFVHGGDERRGNEMQSLQATVSRPQFKQETLKKPLSNPDNASAPATANQPEHSQAGQATAEHRKAQHAQAELAEAQNTAQEVQRRAEKDQIILAEQASSDKVKAGQTKGELKEHKRVQRDITEHALDEKMKENQSESSREQQTKAEQTREEPKHVTGETGAKHRRELQGETVNPEHPAAERLKEERLMTEGTRAKQVQTEHSCRETLKAEQVIEKQEREQGEVELIRLENVQAGQAAAESRKIEHTSGTREHEKTKADEGEFIPEGRVKQPRTQKGYRVAKKAESPRLEHRKLELAKALLVNRENMLEMCTKPAVKLKITPQLKSEPDKVEQVKTELAKAKAELAKIKEKMREEKKEKARNTAPTKDDGENLSKANLDKKEELKHQEGAAQNHQRSQDLAVVSREIQADSGPDDYERLRQKYGFTNTASMNKNKMSAAENVLPTDNSETRSLSPNEFERRKDDDSKDKDSPKTRFASVKTENKRQADSLKPSDGTETPYVYSESSKEFKLSNDYDLLVDKVNDGSVQILEKCNSPKHISKQGGSDLAKVPLDRKNKSAEHSSGPANDPHLTPSRSLSHKERVQTKQEILTSRIKAYAEKEISAIKESLAKPDGFLSIAFSKSTGVSQNPEAQRSPSQEMSNKHDSNTVRMQQMEASGAQRKPLRSLSSTSSAPVPVQSAAPISEFISPSEVPKEAKTSNIKLSETPILTKHSDFIHTKEGFDGNQLQKNKPNIDSPVKCEAHMQQNKDEIKEGTHGAIPGEEKKALVQNSPSAANQQNVDQLKTNEAENSKSEPRETAEEDSRPSLKFVQGQDETPATDDSLQIMGIMVTVRERTSPPMSNKQGKNNTETEPSSAETGPDRPSIGGEVNESVQSDDTLDAHSRMKADQTRAGTNDHPETVKDTSGTVSENVQEKCTNLQQRNSVGPQMETELQELLTEEGPSCSLLTKTKVIDVNESHLYKQDTKERETKGGDELKHDEKNLPQKAHENDNCRAETQKQFDSQLFLKEEMVVNPSESLHILGQISPLLAEQRHDVATVTSFKESGPNQLLGTVNKHKCPEVPMKENKLEEKVHIGSIAIRVVPAEAKDDPDRGYAEKGNGLKTEDKTNDGTPTSSVEIKDSQESGNISSSVKNMPDLLKSFTDQNAGRSEKIVSESKIQPMEGGYFQIERVTETNVKPQSSQNPKEVCEWDLPGLKKAAVSTEGKHEAFALEQAKMKTVESSSENVEDENMETKMRETSYTVPLKQGGSPSEMQCVRNTRADVGKSAPISAQHRPSSSEKERQSSQSQFATSENVKEKQEVRPKTKERTSTIPEISAIADYARLKVIVSEERENTIQEFPPHKKEGFFPLIQSRHSRRPVFTAEPQMPAAKERTLPSKTEIRTKVKKESKPLVFPITEKEHQRTGMFKLGDKEKQEKNTVVTKENHIDKTRNLDDCESKTEPPPKLNQHLHPQPNEKQMDNDDKMNGSHPSKSGEERQETCRGGEKETTTKQKGANHPKEVQAPRKNVEDKTEEIKIKQTIVESRTSLEEEGRRAAQREEERRAREREATAILIKQRWEEQREAERRAEEEGRAKQMEEERRRIRQQEAVRSLEEAKRRAKLQEEEQQKIKNEEWSRLKKHEEGRAAHAAQDTLLEKHQSFIEEEQKRRAEEQEQQRRAAQEEQKRRAEEQEQQRRAAQEEQKRRAEEQEQQRRAAQEEQKRRAEEQEQHRRAAQEEQLRKSQLEEHQRRTAQEEQQRKATEQEHQRRALQEEQQRRAAHLEELQRRTVQEERRRRAAYEEQQRRAATKKQQSEEQQRQDVQKEHRNKAAVDKEKQERAVEDQQKRTAEAEARQRRVAQEEQQRRAAEFKEQQRRAVTEERQRRAAQLEQRMRSAEEEQQKRAANEEHQRRMAELEEQQRRAVEEKQKQKTAVKEEHPMKTAHLDELHRRAVIEEQLDSAPPEKQHSKKADGEQQRKAVIEEQLRRAAEMEKLQRSAQEEQQITAFPKQQRQDEPNISVGEKNQTKGREEGRSAQTSEKKTKQIQNELEHQIEGKTDGRPNREVWLRAQEEDKRRVAHKEKTIIKEREAAEAKVDSSNMLGERHSAVTDEKRVEQEQMSDQRNHEITVKETDGEREMLAAYIEKERAAQMEQQKRASQLIDALQYYTIASAESERKARERRSCSPGPPQRRNHLSALESTGDHHVKLYRQQAPSSPAPSLPRSNTSSPALGNKPSMFRVKDNTLRGSSFVKSVKPRFHKSFGDDFRGVSPIGSEKLEEEQDALRSRTVTPLHLDTGSNRLTAIKDSFPSAYSSQGSSGALQHYRPYSRRSVALDEDDSRSVVSIMSEDVESFATSATDLADVRTLYEYERPESSCSFSSDMSRSLGKPPVVPPKSEKALRRAKRLTTRRIKKELSKVVVDNPLEGSVMPSASSTEVQSSSRTAVATPHSSPPVSLAYAPKQGSSLPSSHTEPQSSLPATAYATGPISVPAASSHVATSVSLPAASPHAIGTVTHANAPKTIANVPSSPTLHHTSHQAPVAKYQFESSYPNSYPLTQRKVLQDVGSGQYFVVDMPVQVRTKTFFDPETGRYVQLKVRESARRPSQSQLQQPYNPPQPQPHAVKLHHQDPPTVETGVFHQGYHRYPQGYQPADISTVPHSRSSVPGTLYQDQQPIRDNTSCAPAAGEMRQDPEEHYYRSEKTPYMDTVNDLDRNYNTLERFPESDANSQRAGSLVSKNDNSAHSQCGSRDIITMSELEDFMELSDW